MNIIGTLNVSDIIFLLISFVACCYLYGRKNFRYFEKLNIKGPSPTAFFGNFLDIKRKGFHETLLRWGREYGDYFGYFMGPSPFLVVCDPEIISEIMVKRFSNFTNRPGILDKNELTGSMLSAAEDDHWKFLRTVISPFYSSKQMREMTPLVEKALATLLKNVGKIADSGKVFNANNLFSAYTMDVIASTGFGLEVDSQENPDSPLVKKANKVFEKTLISSVERLAIVFPFLGKIMRLFNSRFMMGNLVDIIDFCHEVVDERKRNGNRNARKDLLQLMLDAQLEGHENMDKKTEQELKLKNVTDWRTKRGLKDIEIIAQCLLFFLAGFETTASTLSFFAHSMALNPDVQEKLYQEIESVLGENAPNYDNVHKVSYLEKCMDETLRKYSVAIFLSRKCKEECTIKGLKIPSGAVIQIPIHCLHGNPKLWPNPEKFDPERFSEENKSKQTPYSYLPFGGGPRICSGMRLAQLEFKMAVVQILRNFRFVPCDRTENPIEYDVTPLLRPKHGIWLKLERR